MTPPADTAAQEFVQFYGHEAWADWQRLLAHFALGEGFAFLVLLLPGAVGADVCRRHLKQYLAAQGKHLAELPCEWREDARRLPDRLFAVPAAEDLGGLWLGTVIPESDPEIQHWQEAWRLGLASLNQQRNPLRERFACPLVLVGAPWLHALLREAAPDLWSVRTGVVAVTPSRAPEPGTNREVALVEASPGRLLSGESASDPDYALEQAERLRDKPGREAARAQLLLRAGNGFYEHARHEPAEKCLREAAALFAELASVSQEHQPNLARTLNNLATVLSALGRREEALAQAQEAVRIYGQLAQARPDAFLPNLAGSLGTLSNQMSDLGRREEALAQAQEGVRIYGQLAQTRPDAFLPNLATSLNNLAIRLSALGRREEALGQAQEAARIFGQLAQARPDAFLPNLATSLNNLAIRLSALGRREEALAQAQEAVRIYGQLAQARPDAFLPNLAASLNNLATMLNELGRREEALAQAQEAVRIFGQLAQARPDAFLPDLARSLAVQGNVMVELGRTAEAVPLLAEAIRRLAPAFQAVPAGFATPMRTIAGLYFKSVVQARQEPDMALLAPVLWVFAIPQSNAPEK